jgi:hypothetical protein
MLHFVRQTKKHRIWPNRMAVFDIAVSFYPRCEAGSVVRGSTRPRCFAIANLRCSVKQQLWLTELPPG